ncbi:MAG: transposase [Desulfobacterales bacterium]|nr:transposase [Desulfobacterales bacterium]
MLGIAHCHRNEIFHDTNYRIPENHILRKIDLDVDFIFIRKFVASYYSYGKGRPSLDPIIYFKMQILLYLFRLKSIRALCLEIQYNLLYRWFLGLGPRDKGPDHSTLSHEKKRLGLRPHSKIFEHVVHLCENAGIIGGNRVVADASLIKANASKASLKRHAEVIPIKKEEPKKVRKSKKTKVKKKKKARKGRFISNKTHTSSSDPSAKLVSRSGGLLALYYKIHTIIDAKSRVILDCNITSGNVMEQTELQYRINQVFFRFGYKFDEVIADRLYGTGSNYDFLNRNGITAYIPIRDDNVCGGVHSTEFLDYDDDNDRYTCLKGEHLKPMKSVLPYGTKQYSTSVLHCRDCQFIPKCFPKGFKNVGKRCLRHKHEDKMLAAKKRMNTVNFKRRSVERKWKVEGIFGEGKDNHGLERSKFRGRENVQIQAYMISMVQNIKRLFALRRKDPKISVKVAMAATQ